MNGLIEQRKLDMHEYLANERIEELQAENNLLRNALAERNARYWELHEAVARLYKTIEGENRTGRANPL